MTCKEKLQKEHPEFVGPGYKGGARGCPDMYGYLTPPGYCNGNQCEACWNREIPEVEDAVS